MISPDMVVGTSVGAINAALYATGMRPEAIEKHWEKITNRVVFPVNWQFLYFFGRIRSLSHPYRLKRVLEDILPVKTFEECRIPLYITATELVSGRQVFFSSGKIIDAILASIAIPPYYAPYRIGDREYIDGGIGSILALEAANMLQCRQIIAISTYGNQESTESWNIFRVVTQALNIIMRHKFEDEIKLQEHDIEDREVLVIEPKIPPEITLRDFGHTKELIRLGEEEARKMVQYIRT